MIGYVTLDIVIVLNETNTINLYFNRSMIRSCSNPNDLMRFLALDQVTYFAL